MALTASSGSTIAVARTIAGIANAQLLVRIMIQLLGMPDLGSGLFEQHDCIEFKNATQDPAGINDSKAAAHRQMMDYANRAKVSLMGVIVV